jgi:hypothetical protein
MQLPSALPRQIGSSSCSSSSSWFPRHPGQSLLLLLLLLVLLLVHNHYRSAIGAAINAQPGALTREGIAWGKGEWSWGTLPDLTLFSVTPLLLIVA